MRWKMGMVAFAGASIMAGAWAQATGPATVAVQQSDQYGPYLTDAEGRSLYQFMADQQGQEGTEAVSNCYDGCAQAWPPLLTQGEPQAGEQVNADLLGTIERRDGTMQVTYNGWPVYYFARDEAPGDTTGQAVGDTGREWYLLSPTGELITEAPSGG